MKTVTMRELNRSTARVIDAVERGEAFEVFRNGKVVAYISRVTPPPEQKPDWDAHIAWLKGRPEKRRRALLNEFEEDRRRLHSREKTIGNLT